MFSDSLSTEKSVKLRETCTELGLEKGVWLLLYMCSCLWASCSGDLGPCLGVGRACKWTCALMWPYSFLRYWHPLHKRLQEGFQWEAG